MKSFPKSIAAVLCLLSLVIATPKVQGAAMRTFLTTSAYGAGLGALAGATVLAFSDDPGNNLNSIARGASLGLYAGMGVGFYLMNQMDPAANSATIILPQKDGLQAAYQFRF